MSNIEIERKFLVDKFDYRLATSSRRIIQGYLSSNPNRSVRVRILEGHGVLTIKGPSSNSGLSRHEHEILIPLKTAEDLLRLCEPGVIDKIRYEIPFGGHTFEVDEFNGALAGLIIAEVELSSEDEQVELPPWLGMEVTGDVRYYNSYLRKLA